MTFTYKHSEYGRGCFNHCERSTLRALWLLAYAILIVVPIPPYANAGGRQSGDTRRVQLAHVRRVVVIPPFFGTDTIARAMPEPPASGAAASSQGGARENAPNADALTTKPASDGARHTNDAKLAQYAAQLRKLQDEARVHLPQRLTKRAGFDVVPAEETADALKKLGLTPRQMFADEGRIKNTRFPLPLPDAIRKVSDALHADAVVLGVLDEPRRASGKYLYDPLYGISYEPGFAESHAGFYLMLPEGTEVLHGYMRVKIPTSGQGHRAFVLADWSDAQDLMIENLMDEWTYYLPNREKK